MTLKNRVFKNFSFFGALATIFLSSSVLFMHVPDAQAVAAKSNHQKQLVVMVQHRLKPGVDGSGGESDYESYLDAALVPVTYRSVVGNTVTPGGEATQRKFEYVLQEFGGSRINPEKIREYFGASDKTITPAPYPFRKLFNELNFWMIAEDMEFLRHMNSSSSSSTSMNGSDFPDYNISSTPPNFTNVVNFKSDMCNYYHDTNSCYYEPNGTVMEMSDVARYVRMTQRPTSGGINNIFDVFTQSNGGSAHYDCEDKDLVVSPAIEGHNTAQKAFGFYLNHMQGAYLLKKNVQAFLQKYNISTAWIDVEQEVNIHPETETNTIGTTIRVTGSFKLNRNDIIEADRYSGRNGFVKGVPAAADANHPAWPNETCLGWSESQVISGAIFDNPKDGQFLGSASIGQATAKAPTSLQTGTTSGAGSPGSTPNPDGSTPSITVKPLTGNNLIEVVYMQGLGGQHYDFMTDYANGPALNSNYSRIDATPYDALPSWMARLNAGLTALSLPNVTPSTPGSQLISEEHIRNKLWVTVYERHPETGDLTLMAPETVIKAIGVPSVTTNPFFLTSGQIFNELHAGPRKNPDGTNAEQLNGEIPVINASINSEKGFDKTFSGECLISKKSDTGCQNQGSSVDVISLMDLLNANESFVTYVSRWEMIPNKNATAMGDGSTGTSGPLGLTVGLGERSTGHNLCQTPYYQSTAYAKFSALRRPVFHWHIKGKDIVRGEYASTSGGSLFNSGLTIKHIGTCEKSVGGQLFANDTCGPVTAHHRDPDVYNPLVTGMMNLADNTHEFKQSAHHWYGVRGLPKLVPYNKTVDFKRWGLMEKGAMGYGTPTGWTDGMTAGEGVNFYVNPLRNSFRTARIGDGSPYIYGRMNGMQYEWITHVNMDASTKRPNANQAAGASQHDSLFVDLRDIIGPSNFFSSGIGIYTGGRYGNIETHTYVPDMTQSGNQSLIHENHPNVERRQDVFGCGDMNAGCPTVDETPSGSSVPLPYYFGTTKTDRVATSCPGSDYEYNTTRIECVEPLQWSVSKLCEGAIAKDGGDATKGEIKATVEQDGTFNAPYGDHMQFWPVGGPKFAVDVHSSSCPGTTDGGTLDPNAYPGGVSACLSFYRVHLDFVARSPKWPGVFMTDPDGIPSSHGGQVLHFGSIHGTDKVFPRSNAGGNYGSGTNESVRNKQDEPLYECNVYLQTYQAKWTFEQTPGNQCSIEQGVSDICRDPTEESILVCKASCALSNVGVTDPLLMKDCDAACPCTTKYLTCTTTQAVHPTCETKLDTTPDDVNHYGSKNATFHHRLEESTVGGATPQPDSHNGRYYAVQFLGANPSMGPTQKTERAEDECEEFCSPNGETRVCAFGNGMDSCGNRPFLWTEGSHAPGTNMGLYIRRPSVTTQIQGINVAPAPRENHMDAFSPGTLTTPDPLPSPLPTNPYPLNN